ncbi:hypothetical protein BX600DRAFT_113508 [Xylariales sp. PMI_506]|nr:hypothetical protein BX600DRAFT_113508 [Xylariales sp. PMI_506]
MDRGTPGRTHTRTHTRTRARTQTSHITHTTHPPPPEPGAYHLTSESIQPSVSPLYHKPSTLAYASHLPLWFTTYQGLQSCHSTCFHLLACSKAQGTSRTYRLQALPGTSVSAPCLLPARLAPPNPPKILVPLIYLLDPLHYHASFLSHLPNIYFQHHPSAPSLPGLPNPIPDLGQPSHWQVILFVVRLAQEDFRPGRCEFVVSPSICRRSEVTGAPSSPVGVAQ